MGRRIVKFAGAVPRPGKFGPVGRDEDGADRNLAPQRGGAGFGQCGGHVAFERNGRHGCFSPVKCKNCKNSFVAARVHV